MAEFVLSSSAPTIIEWWADCQRRFDAYREAMRRVRDLFPDHRIYDRGTLTGRRIAALEGPNPGPAWRSTRDGWVPRKDARKDPELLELWGSCVMSAPPAPGMARDVWGDYDPRSGASKVHYPGFHLLAGELWCTWARQPDMDQVDASLWTVRKLSAYHLARESEVDTSDQGQVT